MWPTLRLCLAMLLAAAVWGGSSSAAETFDEPDFLTACLIAGGVSDPDELAELRVRFGERAERIDWTAIEALPPDQRAAEMRAELRRWFLTGSYRADASDLRLAICGGDYNCLSAAAIYWELCRRAGLDLELWSRPGHVYVFDPTSGRRIEPVSAVAIAAVPGCEDAPTPARQITPHQLVGKFYYNRGLALLQQGRHEAGLTLIRASLEQDPQDREARGNLLAGLNNWAVALCQEQQFAEAGRLIEQGLAIDSQFGPLVANAKYVGAHHSP